MSAGQNAGQSAGAITYAGGQNIDLANVEHELAGLWRQAGEAAAEAGQRSVTRACLWNLVVYQPPPEQRYGRPSAPRLLDDVTAAVPSRLLRLELRPEAEAPSGGKAVSAWVNTKCNISPGGGHQICTEEIGISGFGKKGQAHFPALVRALLVPDLPVALVWLDSAPHKGRLLRDLLRLSDRILVDTQPSADGATLIEVDELVRETHAQFVDLGWMRLTPVRYMVASLFDAPGRPEQLKHLEGIRIDTTPNGRNSGFLLLGWLLSRLGKLELSAEDAAGREADFRWKIRQENGSFPIEFHVREGEGGLDGLLCLDVAAGGEHFVLRQVDELHVALDSPDHGGKKQALHGWDDAELVVAGLGGPGLDALYPEALNIAARLIGAEAWNR